MSVLLAAREFLERALSLARTRAEERTIGARICEVMEMQDFNEAHVVTTAKADEEREAAIRRLVDLTHRHAKHAGTFHVAVELGDVRALLALLERQQRHLTAAAEHHGR